MEKFSGLSLPYSEIVSAEYISDGKLEYEEFKTETLPKILRVIIKSSFGGESKIFSELWLPENWNGIFLGTGNGGIGGRFWYEPLSEGVSKGYAVAQTDTGTSELKKNNKFHEDTILDYAHRSAHIMTVVSKILIEKYYGKKPEYSYFKGASAGGLQGFNLMQVYPEDYNGILAGVPSNNGLFLVVSWLWEQKQLHTSDGKYMLSKEDSVKITDCAIEFFRLHGDGEEGDDFVTKPYLGENTCEEFLKFLKEKMPHLTSEQLDALKKVYDGPVNPKTGEQIYCGLPFSAEDTCSYFGDSKFEFPWLNCVFGSDYEPLDFDFADDLEIATEKIGHILCGNRPDLTAFKNAGGKMIYFSGVVDPRGPSADAINYYNKVCEKMGGYSEVSKFIKCFPLPGKAHAANGRGTNITFDADGESDLLMTLRRWVEEGKEPEYIIAAHKINGTENFKFKRNVYPYKGDWVEGVDYAKCCSDRYLKMTYKL